MGTHGCLLVGRGLLSLLSHSCEDVVGFSSATGSDLLYRRSKVCTSEFIGSEMILKRKIVLQRLLWLGSGLKLNTKWVCYLMTPGLRKDIQCYVWSYSFSMFASHQFYSAAMNWSDVCHHKLNTAPRSVLFYITSPNFSMEYAHVFLLLAKNTTKVLRWELTQKRTNT